MDSADYRSRSKKCTKLKQKDLKQRTEWTCEKCKIANENQDDM